MQKTKNTSKTKTNPQKYIPETKTGYWPKKKGTFGEEKELLGISKKKSYENQKPNKQKDKFGGQL